MRNLSGRGVAVVCGYCGRAPLSTGAAAVPSGLSDVLHTSGARSLMCDFARRLESSRTLRSLRRPPHRWGLVSCCVGEPHLCLAFGTKLSLLGFLVVRTVQNSPCMSKKRQIEPFRVSRESFVPEVGPRGSCWESFIPEVGPRGSCWESFVPEVGPRGSCWARFVSPWHLPRVQLPGFRHPPVPHPGPRPLQRARHW